MGLPKYVSQPPWKLGFQKDCIFTDTQKGFVLGHFGADYLNFDERKAILSSEANTKIAHAAPEMFIALEHCLDYLQKDLPINQNKDLIKEIKSALIKAGR